MKKKKGVRIVTSFAQKFVFYIGGVAPNMTNVIFLISLVSKINSHSRKGKYLLPIFILHEPFLKYGRRVSETL